MTMNAKSHRRRSCICMLLMQMSAPMDAELAAKIMYADASADVIAAKAEEYACTTVCGVANAARRGYVDLIVEPGRCQKVSGRRDLKCSYTKRVDGSMTRNTEQNRKVSI